MDSGLTDWQISYELLADAIDAVPDGVALFDAEDRYVMWSRRYAEVYAPIADTIAVGARFEAVIRAALDRGLFLDGIGREEEWLADRLAARGQISGIYEHHLDGDRWIRVEERATANGGRIAVQSDITDLKQREESFRLLFESNPIPMFVCHAQTLAFLAVNEAAVCHYGYTGQQFSNMSVYDLEQDNDREDLRQRTQSGDVVWKTGTIRHHAKADGTPIDVAIYSRSMRYHGQPAVIFTATDVTERQLAEDKNRDQKLQLDAAVGNMTQGLVMFGADERLVLWNQLYIDMYNMSPEIVAVGCTHLELLKHRRELGILRDTPEVRRRHQLAHLAEGKPWSYVLDLPDGRFIRVVNRPVADGGWVSTHEDITDRQHAEAKNREQKQQLDAALDNMVQGLVMFDADGRVVLVNQRYLEMFGLSPDIVKVGCLDLDIMKHRKNMGVFSGDPEPYRHKLLARLAEGKLWSWIDELPDGRSIQVLHQPLVNGGRLSTHEDITERQRAHNQIEYLAHHDALTTLPNRASFNGFLSAALENAAGQKGKLGLLCVDIDRFKEVNDVFGHAAGDLLLQKATERFRTVAQGAFVARLGGDEFSILVTDGQQPQATEELAERLQLAMADEIDLGGHLVVTSVSIGVAIFPTDGADADTLLANGDAALYRAKSEGRNCICFFDATMDKELHEQRLLQHELRFAIEDNQLRLAYQPQALTTGRVVGFEALARWQHPKRGLVDAESFVPSAEGSGLVMQLGEWVLREACREAASWNEDLLVAVNLSPVQFKHGDLRALVHSVLDETGLRPDRLVLEITEGVFIDEFSKVLSILHGLKSLGVKIVLDDFGTGFSSLSYLQAFSFDKIKIDKSFVAQLDQNPRAPTIIRTIIGLAHGLSLPAVAEGVETKQQLEFLKREGCDEIQGYLISQPGKIDDFADIVGRAVLPDRRSA